jgi:hypothetical protein
VKAWAVACADEARRKQSIVALTQANLQELAGRVYDQQIGKEFDIRFGSILRKCIANGGADLPVSDFFLRLGDQGAVQELFAMPATAISSCMQHNLQFAQFQPPPKGDYWIKISLAVTK